MFGVLRRVGTRVPRGVQRGEAMTRVMSTRLRAEGESKLVGRRARGGSAIFPGRIRCTQESRSSHATGARTRSKTFQKIFRYVHR